MHLNFGGQGLRFLPGVYKGPQTKVPTQGKFYLFFVLSAPPKIWDYFSISSPCFYMLSAPPHMRFLPPDPSRPNVTRDIFRTLLTSRFCLLHGKGALELSFCGTPSTRIFNGWPWFPVSTGSSEMLRIHHVETRPTSPPLCQRLGEGDLGLEQRV